MDAPSARPLEPTLTPVDEDMYEQNSVAASRTSPAPGLMPTGDTAMPTGEAVRRMSVLGEAVRTVAEAQGEVERGSKAGDG